MRIYKKQVGPAVAEMLSVVDWMQFSPETKEWLVNQAFAVRDKIDKLANFQEVKNEPKTVWFVVERVGLSGNIDVDNVAAAKTKEDAETKLKELQLPPCECDQMCPCPFRAIVEVALGDMSATQRETYKSLIV